MGEIERDGDGGGAIGGEPFVRQVEVHPRTNAGGLGGSLAQLLDALGERVLDPQRQIAQPEVEEFLVRERCLIRGQRGWRRILPILK